MSNDTHVKVLVRLDVVDDWPPVEVEGMWATSLGEGRYKIDNIPFHAFGISDQDVIAAGSGDETGLWFREVLEPSEFSTVRLAVANEEGKQSARDLFKRIGCESEGLSGSMFALSIPQASLQKALDEIRAGEAAGRWDWEEGVIRF